MTITSSANHPASAVARRSAGHRITDWNPEDTDAWDAGNKTVARRNLIWSTVTAHIAYSIWSLWSVMVLLILAGMGNGSAISLILRQAYASRGNETPAFGAFLVGYVVAALLTYLAYVRPCVRRTNR